MDFTETVKNANSTTDDFDSFYVSVDLKLLTTYIDSLHAYSRASAWKVVNSIFPGDKTVIFNDYSVLGSGIYKFSCNDFTFCDDLNKGQVCVYKNYHCVLCIDYDEH